MPTVSPEVTSSATVPTVWRIAQDTPYYTADDRTGTGARITGGRWNRPGTAMLYAATSRALACLETVVHLGDAALPLNRYLVAVTVADADWAAREVFDPAAHIGWDAEPAGMISLDWGTAWAASGRTLLAEVPSVIVPEEITILVNPAHPGAASLHVRKVRRWLYDSRLFARQVAPARRAPPARDANGRPSLFRRSGNVRGSSRRSPPMPGGLPPEASHAPR